MPFTKVYPSQQAAPFTPSNWRASALDATPGLTRLLTPTLVDSVDSFGQTVNTLSVSDAEYRIGIHRAIIPIGAQTIAGTLDACVRMGQGVFGYDTQIGMHVYVSVGQTDAVRGTLLSNFQNGSFQNSLSQNAFDKSRNYPQLTLNPVVCQDGDCLVVEWLIVCYNATPGPQGCNMEFGAMSNGHDASQGDTAIRQVDWLNFSQLILEEGESADATVTTPDNATVNSLPSSQSVALHATVTANDVVSEGTVTFTIFDLDHNVIGTPEVGNVVAGDVNVIYDLPAEIAVGEYTIFAEYSGGLDFLASSGYAVLTVLDTPEDDFCASKQEPILFASLSTSLDDKKWYGIVALPDPSTYYGGWKEDRLLEVSDIRRALAGPSLDYQIGTFSATLADNDYAIRQKLTQTDGRFYTRLEVEAFMITPAGRQQGLNPTVIATGIVDSDPEFDTQDQSMTVKLACRDRLGVSMGWTLTGQTKLPRRVLNAITLPGVVTTMTGKGAWLPWGELSTNIILPSGFAPPFPDGIASRGSFAIGAFWQAGFAPWDQTVPAVTGLALGTSAGGDVPERDFAVQIFPVVGSKVGDPDPYINGDVSVTVVAPNQTINASWTGTAEKYYAVLSAFWTGVWRPQQIIETTSLSCSFDHAFDTPNPGTGLSTGAVDVPGLPFYYYSARAKAGPLVSQWHEQYDNTLYPLQFGQSITLPNNATRPLRVYWDPNAASEYQVKKVAAGPSAPLIFTMLGSSLEAGLVYWDDDFNDSDALPEAANQDRAQGRIKAEYVRDVELPDGNTWHELFWAGVPAKGVDDWYYDPGGDPSTVEVNQDDGTSFLFPKDGTAWDTILPTRYRDVLGSDGTMRRYMMGYARGVKGDLVASGSARITLNVQGIEDVGDCSGDVITDLHDQAKHFLQYFVVASGEGYTSGLWGLPPTQGLAGLPIINTDSFDEVRDMRLAELSGGVIGAGVTGALGELVDVSTELKRWMVSGEFRLGPNRHWQIVCRAINASLTPAFITTLLTDEFDIHNRTFKPLPRLSELQNIWKYRNTRNYITSGWLVDDQNFQNEESITNWQLRKQGEDLEFAYIEDSTVVGHIFGKRQVRGANAPMYITLEGSICLLDDEFDIGRYFKLKHWRGVADGGWTDRCFWILGNTFSPTTKRVTLECLDVTDLIRSNELLEDLMAIQLGGSWFNSPEIPSDPATVDAYEYWDMPFPWDEFPDDTILTARLWGAVPSGVSMTAHIYNVDTASIAATDPTPFTGTSFVIHEFAVPNPGITTVYRLRAVVTGGSGQTIGLKGILIPDLP
jgi:hypothetical protein